MDIIIDKSLVVPVSTDRSNSSQLACGLFDTEKFTYSHGPLATEASVKLKKDISKYKCTLLFVHKKFKVYGVVKDSAKQPKPLLYWIHEKHAEMAKEFILNYEERLGVIDISDKPIEVFKGNYRKEVFTKCSPTDETIGKFSSYDILVKTIHDEEKHLPIVEGGQSNIVIDKVTKEEDTVVIVDDNAVAKNEDALMNIEEDASMYSGDAKSTKEEVIVNIECKDTIEEMDAKSVSEKDSVEDDTPTVVEEGNQTKSNCGAEAINSELMKALVEATQALNETRKELQRTTESYKETMAKSFGDFDLDVETKFVGVTDIKGDLVETEAKQEFSESVGTEAVYEFILKIMKVDDSISLPRAFYEKLTTVIKRNMMLSRDGNKYDSIVLIRFDKTSRDNLVARVEYDSTKDYTRVTVIKQFNGVELTSGQLLDYETKFNQWRRMHSYRIS